MFLEILSWWGRQLKSLLPGGVRRRMADFRPSLRLRLTETASGPAFVEMIYRKRGRVQELGQFPLNAEGVAALRLAAAKAAAGKVELEAASGIILQRGLTFPLAVEGALNDAIRYEFDHETPFSPDEAYWSVDVLTRDRQNARLHVRLAMILKQRIAGPLKYLEEAGIIPSRVIGDGIAIALRQGARSRRRLLPIAGVIILVLVILTAPFVKQSFDISATEQRISSLEPAAREARTLRRRLGDDVREQQAALGDPLAMLAALTDLLPDDTSLTGLSFHDRDLELIGQSSTASALLGKLATAGGFQNPSFSAPVTRNADSTADTFSIKTRFVQ